MKNNTSESVKTDHGPPVQYRLAKDPYGDLILQGLCRFQLDGEYGEEWREIPTVNINYDREQI